MSQTWASAGSAVRRLVVVSVSAGFVLSLLVPRANAATIQVGGASVTNGQNFTLPVTIDSGTPALGFYTAHLSYSSSVVRVTGVLGGANQFSGGPDFNTNTLNQISLHGENGSSLTLPTGSVLVAQIQLTVIGAAGSVSPMAFDTNNPTFEVADTDGFTLPISTLNGLIQVVLPPHLVATPTSLDFGALLIYQTNTKPFQVINTGGLMLTGTTTIAYPFAVATGSSYIVAPGQTGVVSVSFIPGGAGAFSNNVVFTSSNDGVVTSVVTGSSANYHSADYRDARGVIDGSEINRVLSYWRSGGFHCEPLGADGYAALPGNTNCAFHGADYRPVRWVIDGTEINRVLSYWRTGCYRAEPLGADGYAAGCAASSSLAASFEKQSATDVSAAATTINHGSACYEAGGTLAVTNSISYSGTLISLLWRPQLPSGWTLGSVSGDGMPESGGGEIVFTGSLTNNPIQMVYNVTVPGGASGNQQLRGEVEYQLLGMINPTNEFANPDPLVVSACAGLQAGFNAAVTNGLSQLKVTFTDTSSGGITNRYWEFGDGAVSNTTATTVVHTYRWWPPGDVSKDRKVNSDDSLLINQALAGLRQTNSAVFLTNLTVRLTVAGAGGASTNEQPGLITLAVWANGDVNQNGSVSSADSLLINQVMVGLRSYVVTKIEPMSRVNTVPTVVTIYGVGIPTNNTVSAVTIGPPVSLVLTNVVVISEEQIQALVPAGGGVGTGMVNVVATPTNGVISFGKFINQ